MIFHTAVLQLNSTGIACFCLIAELVVIFLSISQALRVDGVVNLRDTSFLFHLRTAFQSRTNTEKVLYNESHYALTCYKN